MSKEAKSQNFIRLAEKRVNAILDKVRVLSNLSNTGLYSYSEAEVRRVFDGIKEATKIAEASFRRGEREQKKKFTFV